MAIDLALHNVFWRSTLPRYSDVDVVVGLDADPYQFMQPEELPELILSPGEFVLGETAEAIGIAVARVAARRGWRLRHRPPLSRTQVHSLELSSLGW